MLKEKIESESRKIAEHFGQFWPQYTDINFDKTFSLRNWATTLASIVLQYNNDNEKNSNIAINNNSINNEENNNYKKLLETIFNNKKILHIGCGYGYFLEVVKSLKGIPYGIEPYCSFPSGLDIFKGKIEDLQDNNSELTRSLADKKFDVIVAHDLFVSSIMISKEHTNEIIGSLKKYLENNGIIVFENQNEETLLDGDNIEKLGFKVEVVESIVNPYGKSCTQTIIRI
ncbi:hypothetical protein CMO94_03650 [Candidatus Woesearchaeota archaeon]|jgi:hypothetical protein|nr:hypothetical protein [Candidatus Woesearchaeota archaeon]|tara:strand:- start:9150 stop:9836 length:687 start_codon:yes stop_codon:yes gene_type:complete